MNYKEKLGIGEIQGFCKDSAKRGKAHWDSLAKPLYGLGKLEDIIIKICGIVGDEKINLNKKATVVMCSDNGVVAEGVTQTDQDVTKIVSENIANGIASVAKMASVAGSDIFAIDIGIASDSDCEKLINKKVSYGTKSFLHQAAMTEEEAIKAILVGIDTVKDLKEKGYTIIATGEMGIGNTSTSSAMASVLLDMAVEKTVGRGAGLDDIGLQRKKDVISSAIKLHNLDSRDPFKALCCVGGLDIAGLVGVFIGGAIYNMPIVIDGLITAVAALTAAKLIPEVNDITIASHMGKEPAISEIMKALDLKPIIHSDLGLGEGTGAVMLFPLIDMAMSIYSEDYTFDKFNIKAYEDYGADK